MFVCHRCGTETPRLSVQQIHCPQCQREVAAIIASDERRRTRVIFRAGDVTPWSGRAAA